MESIRPEDRPKVIGLLIGVVLVFVFVFLRISSAMGGGSSAKPAPAAAAPVATTTAAAEAPAEADVIDVPTLFASATLDPFQRVLPDRNQLVASNAASSGRGRVSFTPGVLKPTIDVRPLPTTLESGGITPMQPGASPEMTVKREEPKLKGIVYGSKPIAVFTLEEDEFVVGVGQENPSGFVVEKIGNDSVDLRKGGEKFHLTMSST